jgi:hypothetical protein
MIGADHDRAHVGIDEVLDPSADALSAFALAISDNRSARPAPEVSMPGSLAPAAAGTLAQATASRSAVVGAPAWQHAQDNDLAQAGIAAEANPPVADA